MAEIMMNPVTRIGARGRPIGDRKFWSRVEPNGACWTWLGYRGADGYGRSKKLGESQAHRVAWRLLRGQIGEGLELDHLCRNRGCVNPAHLEPVTPRENTLRSSGVTAKNARKSHCVHGHPFDAANTYFDRSRPGTRSCRACGRAIQARRRKASAR